MTNSEAIRDLSDAVSTLKERLNYTRDEMVRIETVQARLSETVIATDKKLAVIQEQIKQIREIMEEKDRRRWSVLLAFLGSLLTLVVNIALLFIQEVRNLMEPISVGRCPQWLIGTSRSIRRSRRLNWR